jgi:riboflavin biosynthesis pyrimidine reductase
MRGYPQGGKIDPVMKPVLRRLLPSPAAPITIAEAYDVERRPWPDRPWIGLCMVTSLDGSVSVDGTSGGLGNANDLEVLLTLRDLADIVLVGAGTARGEGYGPPRTPGKRIGVVTNSGRVDLDTDLFTSGSGFLIAPQSADIDESRVQVIRSGDDRVDLAAGVARLHEVLASVRYVQAEGGPSLNGALLTADLIDELDLTVSPRLVGGNGPRLTTGALETERSFELAHLLADDDGFVFSRWVRRAC